MKKGDFRNSIYLKLLEYGIDHCEGFTKEQVLADLVLSDWEKEFVIAHFGHADRNRNSGLAPLESIFLYKKEETIEEQKN